MRKPNPLILVLLVLSILGNSTVFASSQTHILHLQDIHLNESAQRNIGLILKTLVQQNQVDLIACEGAFGEIDLKAFQLFPHPATIQKVADYLLTTNQISGPIHFALQNGPDTPPLVGIDDPTTYRSHVAAYKEAFSLRDEAFNQWNILKKSMEAKKIREFNPKLAQFDRLVEDYRSKRIDFEKYRQMLASYSASSFLWDFPNVESLLQRCHESEKKIALSLCVSDRERKVLSQSRYITLMGKIIEFSLSSKEWKEYMKLAEDHENSQGALVNCQPFERFYELAQIRDSLMAKNLIHAMDRLNAKKVVFISGGFHSEGLAAHFKKKNISFFSYLPRGFGWDGGQGTEFFLSPEPMAPAVFQRAQLLVAAEIHRIKALSRSFLIHWLPWKNVSFGSIHKQQENIFIGRNLTVEIRYDNQFNFQSLTGHKKRGFKHALMALIFLMCVSCRQIDKLIPSNGPEREQGPLGRNQTSPKLEKLIERVEKSELFLDSGPLQKSERELGTEKAVSAIRRGLNQKKWIFRVTSPNEFMANEMLFFINTFNWSQLPFQLEFNELMRFEENEREILMVRALVGAMFQRRYGSIEKDPRISLKQKLALLAFQDYETKRWEINYLKFKAAEKGMFFSSYIRDYTIGALYPNMPLYPYRNYYLNKGRLAKEGTMVDFVLKKIQLDPDLGTQLKALAKKDKIDSNNRYLFDVWLVGWLTDPRYYNRLPLETSERLKTRLKETRLVKKET